MVRNTKVEAVDGAPRAAIALENHYPDGHVVNPHVHRRGQLISTASGALVLGTPDGTWVMPPQRGMWIPPGVSHHVRMVGEVNLQSIYLEPAASEGMPPRCQVVAISPFLRSLITRAVDEPLVYDLDGYAGALMALIQHEVRRLPALPLSLPFPPDRALAERCRRFLRQPDVHETIEAWAGSLNMGRRTFTRFFRAQTGLSFMAWRQQACLLAALPRLAAGEAVTAVAADLGYDNPAAFTAMFRRLLGTSPRGYLKAEGRN